MKTLKILYLSLAIFGTVILTLEGLGLSSPTVILGVVMWKCWFVFSSTIVALNTLSDMLELL